MHMAAERPRVAVDHPTVVPRNVDAERDHEDRTPDDETSADG